MYLTSQFEIFLDCGTTNESESLGDLHDFNRSSRFMIIVKLRSGLVHRSPHLNVTDGLSVDSCVTGAVIKVFSRADRFT